MPISVTMPALSPTMTEGTLARWLVKEGDRVNAGDVIAEIETDKATMEVESVEDGIVGRILVPEGTEGVAVNAPILVILGEDEDSSALEGFTAESAPVVAPTRTEPTAPAEPTQTEPTAPAEPAPSGPARPAATGDRVFASPLARRMASGAGIDLAALTGSGPRGRIVKADVEAAIAAGGPTAVASETPAPGAESSPSAAPAQAAEYEEIPLTAMRKVMARRLSEAKRSIPHFYLTIDCELDALLEMRRTLNAKSDDYALSVNDFVVRACALALRRVPEANASWAGDKIIRYLTVDVAVAVALDDGLITPVIRNADQMGLAAISGAMKELAARARAGKLLPEEYQGGGFTVSNLGMYGIREFAAVINPPQGAILAVGAGEKRPVVKDGALAVATVMTCTLSCDHRVVDGALGARFLAAFKGYVEDPVTMLL